MQRGEGEPLRLLLHWQYDGLPATARIAMRIRDHPTTAAAILLAGTVALPGLLGHHHWPAPTPAAAPVQQLLPAPGTRVRTALEWCRENVAIIHDVYWASACAVAAKAGEGEDSTDCTLSYERARPLNAARAVAEERCVDEAVTSARGEAGR